MLKFAMMNDELKQWTIEYAKNKDISAKKLVKVDEKKDCVEFHFKDKVNTHYIMDKMGDNIFSQITNSNWKTIICPNTEENFSFLIKNWNKLSGINNLTLIFVNLKTQDKWIINPKLHSMVADPDSINSGLKTMFDTANGKIAEVPKGKKKASMFEESSNSKEDEENEGDDEDGN